jgi:membrane fusion protein, heavy metal efflux system
MIRSLPRAIAAAAVVASLSMLTAGCSREGSVQSAGDPRGATEKKGDAVVLDRAMLASIKVDAVAERPLTSVLSIAGKVQFDEDRIVRLIPPIAGQVVGLRVKVGDRVRAGDTICAISSREAAAAVGEYFEARTDLDLAEKQAAITRDLFAHEAASRVALQQSENDLGKAQLRFARTGEALRVLGLAAEEDLKRFNGRLPITSPIDGSVVERRVTEGQFVQVDPTPMVTIASLDTVWVMGDLFERDLRFATRGLSASIATAAYPGDTFRGRVDYISEAIDPSTRTAKVRVAVANANGRLKPEMFVTIALDVAGDARGIVVPESAVFAEQGRMFVYIDAGGGRFSKRPIEIAQDHGTERRVLSGLAPGERVVVEGVLLLRQEEQQAS